jgi:hypothetical protein
VVLSALPVSALKTGVIDSGHANARVNSIILILLKNPIANFDLSVAEVLPVIIFIDAYRNGETT